MQLEDCTLLDDAVPATAWSTAFPAGQQMPELTSLQLSRVTPQLHAADLQNLVQCCPALRSLHTCHVSTDTAAHLSALQEVTGLTSLGVKGLVNAVCSELAKLTRLSELRVRGYAEADLDGLLELTALQGLTSLGFSEGVCAATMSHALRAALTDVLPGCRYALVNKVKVQEATFTVFVEYMHSPLVCSGAASSRGYVQ